MPIPGIVIKSDIMKKLKNILIIILINLVILMILGEIVSRVFWSAKYDISFFSMEKIIYMFYPKMRYIDNNYKDDSSLKILFLGASVLDSKMSTIQYHLEEDLRMALNRDIEIYNIATLAQTTIDSRVKYDYLKNRHFDYILLYHGINDLAANSAPDSMFTEDYSMFWWYYQLKTFRQHPEKKYCVLFYTLHYAVNSLLSNMGILDVHTIDRPKLEWLVYGRNNKSLPVFKRNMEYIINDAERRGIKVIMSTFINYVPYNYSERLFNQKLLDYDKHICPNSEWGSTINIKKGLEENNEVIISIAGKSKNVLFEDMNSKFTKNRTTFNDICHLTDWGAAIFSTYVTNLIMKDLGMRGINNETH